jgi:hypothetical protein
MSVPRRILLASGLQGRNIVMRKRPLFGLGLLVLLALLGAFATQWLVSLRPGVTKANFERIRFGMTALDVDVLLGETNAERIYDPSYRRWLENGMVVQVSLDMNGLVVTKSWDRDIRGFHGTMHIPQESFWDKIHRLMGL